MREIVSTITSKGRVTIPDAVRKFLGLSVNDKIAFIMEDGAAQIATLRYPNVDALRGVAGSLDKPRSWQEVRTIAREERLAAKYAPEEPEDEPSMGGSRCPASK